MPKEIPAEAGDQRSPTTSQDPSRLCAPARGGARNLTGVPNPGEGQRDTLGSYPGTAIPPFPHRLGCLSSLQLLIRFSFTFLFAGGLGLLEFRALTQFTRSLSQRLKRKGSRVAAPSGWATCRPSPCSPDSMEVQSSASPLWEGRC